MTDFNQLPSSISHKQLKKLLLKATKNLDAINFDNCEILSEKEEFENLLKSWANKSKEIVDVLNKKNHSILEERHQKSSMALGALEAHLSMALHAYKASQID
tara:strand:+ start:6202 stop:6507 length:306 start_codon:yes stop_codon:yes gene_type:complete